jgi:hypothetical protein
LVCTCSKQKKKETKGKTDQKEKTSKREEAGAPAEEDDEDIPSLEVGKGRIISSGRQLSYAWHNSLFGMFSEP